MASFHQKIDNVKDSLASLFKSRRSRHRSRTCSNSSGSSSSTGNCISTPQNVKRVMHVTFDAQKGSFDGIPSDWRPYFDAAAATTSTVYEELTMEEPSRDDSGVSMATGAAANTAASTTVESPLPTPPPPPPSIPPPPPPPPPKELLSLTYDRDCGKFVDLPHHWRERLQRNNLLAPEFQNNPDLLVSIFALMDEELRAMSQEGFSLDKAMYSSSPTLEGDSQQCHSYVYEIAADSSNSSSEQDLLPSAAPSSEAAAAVVDNDVDDNLAASHCHRGVRRPSLVRMRAVAAPSAARKLP